MVLSSCEGVQGQLVKEEQKRQAERAGRIRTERQLKACSQQDSSESASSVNKSMQGPASWTFKPLGELRSVFTQRHARMNWNALLHVCQVVSHSFSGFAIL